MTRNRDFINYKLRVNRQAENMIGYRYVTVNTCNLSVVRNRSYLLPINQAFNANNNRITLEMWRLNMHRISILYRCYFRD